ncbi:MAG TPA: sigma-54 dependent transcriptional regulator [Polyangiales bacterium]|nr:sigma-54 dependent transcriptional regulator [Polyangiales bacterium]
MNLLVIEDDLLVRSNILDLLEAEGYTGIGAENGERGVELAVQHLPDLVICDVSMPGIDGYQVYEILRERPATAVIPFIFLSARADRADVRRGMALGADDYVTKPFTRMELLDSIRARLRRSRGSEQSHTPRRVELQSSMPPHAAETDRFVIRDPAMRAVYDQLARASHGPISVLILGETGVGKELLAEAVHQHSGRTGRFVALNCAALNEHLLESELFGHEKGAFTGAISAKEGLLETADGGTLFLDEVGELPHATQVKLLRVLEERKVLRVGGRTARSLDIRLVAATHRDLEAAIDHGEFRADLYYRLNGIALNVPPLRERKADIEALARHFVARAARESRRENVPQLSEPVLRVLLAYHWPGNIRELRNVLERAVLLCDGDELTLAHLPPKLAQPPAAGPEREDELAQLSRRMEEVERQRIIDALTRCGGNQTQAAELLGVSRRTLVTRLSQYNLPRPRSGSRQI